MHHQHQMRSEVGYYTITVGGGGGGATITSASGSTSLLERTKPGYLRDQEARIKQMEFELRNRRLEDEVQALTKMLNEYKQKIDERDKGGIDLANEARQLREENEELYTRVDELESQNRSLREITAESSEHKEDLAERLEEYSLNCYFYSIFRVLR